MRLIETSSEPRGHGLMAFARPTLAELTSMNASNIFASLALVISLVSLGLSYRAARLEKMVRAAEKRTQAHSILAGVLLEVEELLFQIRAVATHGGTGLTLPSHFGEMESQLAAIAERIPERLNWLREKNSNDSILLEEYKTYSLEIEARVKQIAMMIREIRMAVKGAQ